MVFDLELTTDIRYRAIVQIQCIAKYNSFWHFIPTYDIFLQEFANCRICDVGIRSGLYPHGKVINDYEYESMPIRHFWQD